MKLYHFALVFFVIVMGFVVTAQIVLVRKMQKESTKRTEYDCLVSAVNAAVDVVFQGNDNTVTEAGLIQAEEVFFQTLAVLHEGATDKIAWKKWRRYVPCLIVFEENGYYRYCCGPEGKYGWSELIPYKAGKLPESFFAETERLLEEYQERFFHSSGKYRLEQAGKGIWEQNIVPPCVFAIYAPYLNLAIEEYGEYLYAASGSSVDVFYVTDDGYSHLVFCDECRKRKIVARYNSQKESAKAGAQPCEYCLK